LLWVNAHGSLKLENSPPEKIDYFGFVLPSLQLEVAY